MSSIKKTAQNLLLLFAGCLIAFLLIEAVLRIHNPFAFSVKGDKITLEANIEFSIKNDKIAKLDNTITYRKNSLGFRGEEPPKDFDDHLTLITVGGSTTECSLLSEGKTWTDQLGSRLKGNFRNIWINNAGLEGHSTYGHKILMKDYLIDIAPDLVLFLVGTNDVAQKDFGIDREILRKGFQLGSLRSIMVSLANHSEAFSIALNIYRYVRAEIIGVTHQELILDGNEMLDLSDDKIEAVLNSHRKGYIEQYETRINELIQMARDNSITPVFITQPALFGDAVDDITKIDLGRLKAGMKRNGKLAWAVMELYNDVLRKAGVDNNVLVIDLANEMPKSSRYYYDFTHYTNEGAEKVSEIIHRALCPYLAKKQSGLQQNSCTP